MLNLIKFIINSLRRTAFPDEEPRVFEEHEEPQTKAVVDGSSVSVEVVEPEEEPEIEEPGRMAIGVWAGTSSLLKPKRDVEFCRKIGINRLDIIVNDHSKSRSQRDFDMHKVERIEVLSELAKESGMEVHIMSWVMPHADYIRQAAKALVPLCNDLGIDSLQWDAEEPWTQARDPMPYSSAADLLSDEFRNLKCPMGVNGIGYTPTSKFKPLADICEYIVPQCYATKTSKMNPTTVVPKFVRRYRAKFGVSKPIQVGLAAYRQPPKGFTIDGAMAASFAGAEAIEGCDAVIYWSLGWLRRSRSAAKFIKNIANK